MDEVGDYMASLRDLQHIELEMIKYLDEMFRKNNLRYFLLGGSLLGAVRHKGFIPWDDDIDVGMPRSDYERFLRIIKHTNGRYKISWLGSKKYYNSLYFVKIINPEYLISENNDGVQRDVHPWVDIFPLDGVPQNGIKFLFWKYYTWIIYRLYMFSRNSETCDPSKMSLNSAKNVMKYITLKSGLINILDKKSLYKKLDRQLKKYDFDKSDRVINFCGFWHFKEMFPKSVYDNAADYRFEDILLRGPTDYNTVLTQMYGNYMTPPPEADRKHHTLDYSTLRKIKQSE